MFIVSYCCSGMVTIYFYFYILKCVKNWESFPFFFICKIINFSVFSFVTVIQKSIHNSFHLAYIFMKSSSDSNFILDYKTENKLSSIYFLSYVTVKKETFSIKNGFILWKIFVFFLVIFFLIIIRSLFSPVSILKSFLFWFVASSSLDLLSIGSGENFEENQWKRKRLMYQILNMPPFSIRTRNISVTWVGNKD